MPSGEPGGIMSYIRILHNTRNTVSPSIGLVYPNLFHPTLRSPSCRDTSEQSAKRTLIDIETRDSEQSAKKKIIDSRQELVNTVRREHW